MSAGKCYACDGAAEGYALRDQDGGPARGEDSPSTVAVPACPRHAWDPDMHPALERLAPALRLELVPCTLKRAMEFVTWTHRHHEAPQGGLWAVGVKKGHKLVGVAIVGRPVARLLQDGKTAEVTRVATREEANACSMGRVNSLRRLLIVKAAGAHSFDGSGPSRFAKALEEMEAARAVMAQIGLVLMIRADCFFEVGGEVFYVLVEVDDAATIDAILLAAADAEAGDVFEVQTDAGLYELVGGEWVFKPWERLENET